MTSNVDPDLPALLGGRAWRQAGPAAWPPVDEQTADALRQMAADRSWGQYAGPHAGRLCAALQQACECEHVLLCSSGRAAMELALRGLSVGVGDDVAMSAYDFYSNFGGIQQVGATPVLCDVRAGDAQLDVPQVADALRGGARCLIASHLHGGLVDMPALKAMADADDVSIIEDACQASGAGLAGRPVGSWGDVGVLSFGGSKLLSAGCGGALLTNRADVIQRIRRHLRGDNHAYPLSEMQAAVLLPQLTRLPERHRQREQAVISIDAALRGVKGLRRFAAPSGEAAPAEASPAFYKVGFFYETWKFGGLSREVFCQALRAEGLPVDPGLPALQTIRSPRGFRTVGALAAARSAGSTVVGLHHPILLDETIDWSGLAPIVERIRDHVWEITRPTAAP